MDAPTSLARTRAYVRHVGSSHAAMLSVLSQLRASLRKWQSMYSAYLIMRAYHVLPACVHVYMGVHDESPCVSSDVHVCRVVYMRVK